MGTGTPMSQSNGNDSFPLTEILGFVFINVDVKGTFWGNVTESSF
jgi:hypothetical protein